jgi:hypothetical protein
MEDSVPKYRGKGRPQPLKAEGKICVALPKGAANLKRFNSSSQ